MPIVINAEGLMAFVVGLAGFVGAVVFLVRPAQRTIRLVHDVMEALRGEPAQPDLGRPARPGLFVAVADLTLAVETIRHEVQTNGGGSLKDEVKALRAEVGELHAAMAELRAARDGAPV